MRLTKGAFSFLPDLTDDQIELQIGYILRQGWAAAIEYTDDPHPRNSYWEMWEAPMFDLQKPAPVMEALKACRAAFPQHYVRVVGFDSSEGFETIRLSFIVQRPADEPGFELVRQEVDGRSVRYTLRSYATERPAGRRYG